MAVVIMVDQTMAIGGYGLHHGIKGEETYHTEDGKWLLLQPLRSPTPTANKPGVTVSLRR